MVFRVLVSEYGKGVCCRTANLTTEPIYHNIYVEKNEREYWNTRHRRTEK